MSDNDDHEQMEHGIANKAVMALREAFTSGLLLVSVYDPETERHSRVEMAFGDPDSIYGMVAKWLVRNEEGERAKADVFDFEPDEEEEE